jgi:hypothetical protein
MSEDVDKLFAGGAINSPIGRIIGMAEGNRTADGGLTNNYYGHTDPGNGAWNMGNYSVNGAYYSTGSPEDADRIYHAILQNEAERVAPLIRAAGLDPGNALLMASYLDIWNQSPIMATEGFLATLPYIAKNGITPDTMLQARIYAGDAGVGLDGFNPTGVAHRKLWTDMAGHSRDQQRRMEEIVGAMGKVGIPVNGTLSGLPPVAISGDSKFTPMAGKGNRGEAATLSTNGGAIIIGTYTRDCSKTPPWDWTMQMGKIYRGCALRITTLGIKSGTSTTPMQGAMTTTTTKATTKATLVSNVTPPKPGSLVYPVPGVEINSPMGMRWGRMHNGVDMAADFGTPILAAMDGVITRVDFDPGGYGNYITIKHNDSSISETLYGHMESTSVTVGQEVKAGQPIGAMGSTGGSTGPHLHFEVRDNNDQRIDPASVLPPP